MVTQSRIGWRPYVTQVVNAVDADATAFIAAAGITNLTQAAAISTLVNDLKTYGLWTKMKALYPMVGGSAASHKFNLKDPRDLDAAYRLVFNGGWVHTSTGAKPNGTTGYADTKLIPSVLSTNSQHLSYYSRTQIISGQIEIGANSSANNNFLGIYYSPTSGLRTSLASGTRTNIAIPSTNTQGFFMSNRPSSTYINIWKNNSKLTTDNITSTGNDNAVMYIGAVNGTTIQYSTKESAFASIGEGFTDTEATNFYNSVQKFQTTLGRHVGTPYVSDPDAIAFLMAAGITDGNQAVAINTLVIRMKADGVWTKMKAIYPFVGGNANSHKFNLKDPRDLDAAFRLVFNGGWTHTGTGALPNGTTGYADTKLVPSSVMTNYNSHMSFYSRTQSLNSGVDIGSHQNHNYFLQVYTVGFGGGTRSSLQRNDYDFAFYQSSSTIGHFMGQILSQSNSKIYTNGVLRNTNTTNNAISLPSINVYIGSLNINGVAGNFTNRESAFVSIGDVLTDVESTSLYNAVQAYQTTLGRQVNVPLVSDGDAQSFLNAANITSFQQASAVNKLVIDLKAAGVWIKMKAIYPFVGGSATSHKFNLKDPRDSDDAFRLVFNGGWTHTGTGALPNGTTGYADTKMNANSTNFDYQSMSTTFYSRTNNSLGVNDIGVQTGSSKRFIELNIKEGNLSYMALSHQGISYLNFTNNDSRGFYHSNRIDSNTIKLYKNGTNVATGTQTSTNIYGEYSVYISALNARHNNNQVLYFSNREVSFTTLGSGLTDTESTALYTAVQTYQTTLGRAVDTPVYNNGLVLNLDAGNANSYPGTGTTWFDLASGTNGTITNGPTYDTTNGGSLLFDGVNDFSGHPIINFGTSSVSWSFWIKPSRYVSTFEAFIGQGQYNVNGGGMLYGGLRNDSGPKRIQFAISSDPNAVNSKSIIIDNAYTTNTWMNLTITYNSSTRDLFMYINGVKQSVTTNTTGNFNNTSIQQSLTPTNTTGRMLSLCMYDESRTNGVFSGNMATTQIYFRSLSDIEVLNYFNSTRGRFGL